MRWKILIQLIQLCVSLVNILYEYYECRKYVECIPIDSTIKYNIFTHQNNLNNYDKLTGIKLLFQDN